jgi:hypothetical protein
MIQNELIPHILSADGTMPMVDGITNHRDYHSVALENPKDKNMIHFYHTFYVNM